MNLTIINKGSKKPEKVAAQACCWWVAIAVQFEKRKKA